jgi:hypothetical protein|eukprot:CAMPEP_0174295374 /NCGR_PEP_ID=MMETSP0809-20121228/44519_1 /TAXON_ID=73025 ORGANISM="Eutreptiella gymnastica-like, Strain CCMP1594" /NCGR_SAMPLE_ID=MMETSP0809 /ASSEMBLY_ACC=CAM_ASM_000658 /LENGTH=164 /DNA_ID=CAMNT_0015397599 /DNA_START=25 /DNA_END=519 /DNA_ORIENTATION=-
MNWNQKETNEVHLQTIWAEHIAKERLHRADKESFSINPHKLRKTVLTEPVSTRPKRFLDKDHVLLESINRRLQGDVAGSTFRNADTKLPDHLDKTLKAVHDMPKDKYPYPQTEQQEVGWVSDPLVREARDSKFTHPKHTCDITRFAANIISASCVDPFKKSAPK